MAMSNEEYKVFLDSLTPMQRQAELKANRKILCKGGRVRRLPKKVYHLSPIENRESILEQGILPNVEGAIFVCPTKEECILFVANANNKAVNKATVYDVWEIDTRKTLFKNWYVNDAYNKNEITSRSFVYFDNRFLPFQIKRVGDLHVA